MTEHFAHSGAWGREERCMLERFGEAYRDYRQHCPMFVPRWGEWRRFAYPRRAA